MVRHRCVLCNVRLDGGKEARHPTDADVIKHSLTLTPQQRQEVFICTTCRVAKPQPTASYVGSMVSTPVTRKFVCCFGRGVGALVNETIKRVVSGGLRVGGAVEDGCCGARSSLRRCVSRAVVCEG